MNRIIDVHTHMFNGHYVPLKDIFHYKFGLADRVSGALAGIVNSLVHTKPEGEYWLNEDKGVCEDMIGWNKFAGADHEEEGTQEQVAAFADYLMDVLSKKIDEEISSYNASEVLSNALSSNLLDALITIIEEDPENIGGQFSRDEFIRELSPYFLLKDRLSHDLNRLKNIGDILRKFGLNALMRLLGSLSGHISFVGKMLLHEKELANHLTGSNYRDEDKPALTIHLMMDMEPAFIALGGSTPPKLNFKLEQIPDALDATIKAGGKLLGFVAYDPRREGGLEIVKNALNSGYIGVKLYPPMGYLPNDLDKFGSLYDYCIENSVPIMTHCTPVGFDAKKDAGFGLNSDPGNWEKVLKQKRYNDLIICFGHAGGGNYEININRENGKLSKKCFKGWFDLDNSEWGSENSYPSKIIELCQTYQYAYTDMSYLHEMISNDEYQHAFVRRLKDAVGSKPGKDYDFGNKIMYGSDWHMSGIVNKTNAFLDLFQSIFNDNKGLAPYSDKFFYTNAIDYLRLAKYLEKQKIDIAHSPLGLEHLKQIVAQA